MESSNFRLLIDAAADGDERAVEQLFDQYGEAIRREVRFSLLDARLRRVVSESDVCQSVMTKLVLGLWAGNYEFENPSQLMGLLKTMVRSRVSDLARHWTAQRRDLRRNVALTSAGQRDSGGEQSPSSVVASAELLHEIRQRLTERDRRILELRQRRVSWPDIARQLDHAAGPEALRKQYSRSLTRVAQELGLDDDTAD